MIIYKTTNLINSKIYVGQDLNNNKYYLGSGIYFKNALKKYGKENFIKEILEVLPENFSQNEANEAEAKWIKFYNSTDKNVGYNLMSFSGQGGKHSEESREKMSNSAKGRIPVNKGKIMSEEQKQKLRKPKTIEHKIKLSQSKQGEKHPNFGKHLSEETKLKISNSERGKIVSDISKNKISNSIKKLYNDEKYILKMKLSHIKPVIQFDKQMNFIAEYNSIKEASDKTNIKSGRICYACKSVNHYSSGFIWKYKNEVINNE